MKRAPLFPGTLLAIVLGAALAATSVTAAGGGLSCIPFPSPEDPGHPAYAH